MPHPAVAVDTNSLLLAVRRYDKARGALKALELIRYRSQHGALLIGQAGSARSIGVLPFDATDQIRALLLQGSEHEDECACWILYGRVSRTSHPGTCGCQQEWDLCDCNHCKGCGADEYDSDCLCVVETDCDKCKSKVAEHCALTCENYDLPSSYLEEEYWDETVAAQDELWESVFASPGHRRPTAKRNYLTKANDPGRYWPEAIANFLNDHSLVIVLAEGVSYGDDERGTLYIMPLRSWHSALAQAGKPCQPKLTTSRSLVQLSGDDICMTELEIIEGPFPAWDGQISKFAQLHHIAFDDRRRWKFDLIDKSSTR